MFVKICIRRISDRVQNYEDKRTSWINAIKEHTEFMDCYVFNVCIRHFEKSDLIKKKDKFALKTDAIPKNFQITSPEFMKKQALREQHIDLDEASNDLNAVDVNIANQFTTTTNHDVKVQGLEHTIERLKMENSDKSEQLVQIKKQLKGAESKIEKLNGIIVQLKANRYITANLEEQKKIQLDEIIDCLCNGLQNRKDSYPESVRSFCLSAHYLSPRAYNFFREKFNNNLPHESTIKAWYRNSNIDVTPGIIKNAMDVLKTKADRMKENGMNLVVSLMFDEVSIRKHVQWCPAARKFLGHVTYGHDENDENVPIANQAIVFMVSGLIAYYFITSLDADDRSKLLGMIIEELSKYNIKVASVTFDGFPANATMCENLGASLSDDINPTIRFDETNFEIQVILLEYDPLSITVG